MGLLEFESCCLCVPLRVGTLILGYLYLIFSVLGMVVSVFFVINGVVLARSSDDTIHHSIQLDGDERLTSISNEQAAKIAGIIFMATGIIIFILCLFQLIFAIFLLVGGHNGKPAYIKTYLVYSVVMLVIAIILTIVSLIAAPSIQFISHFCSYALQIYFLLVIRSYMVTLRDNPEGDRAGKVYKSVYRAAGP